MSSKRITSIIALLIAALLLVGFVLYQSGYFDPAEEPATDTAAATAPPAASTEAPIPVNAMIAQPKELKEFITVSGSTTSAESVMISSEVPGKVQKILFREGDYVKAGTSLIRLDDEELQAERKRQEVSAELNAKIAERLRGLYEKQGVSLQEVEVAEAEYKRNLAELALVDAQLEKRIIHAPFSGRLGLRLISEGSYLAPGTPVVSLVSANPIKIEFSIPEKYSPFVGKGTEVEFDVASVPGKLQARVEASDPTIDPQTRTFRLKATAPNPRGTILPGAFANVRVNLESFADAIMVPTEAVVPELGGKKIFVYRSGEVAAIPVETGIRQSSSIQITEGLVAGDTVITTGVLQIRPGSPVTITNIQ